MTRDNLMAIARSTDRYNFHAHTQFCDGRATISEFADRAVTDGFKYYGFSPHSPLPIESPCNMKADDVEAYMAEVDAAQQRYAGRIKFYKAMEIDYLDDSWGPSDSYFANLGLDYSIGSIHFIPCGSQFIDIDGRYESFRQKMAKYFANDIRHVVETFYSQSVRMLEAGGFEIIGHFDKIGHNASHFKPGIEDEPWYQTLVGDLIDLIKEKGVIAEVNTKAWADHKRFFPGERYFKRLRSMHIPLVVNSDSHYLHLLNASRSEAIDRIFSN